MKFLSKGLHLKEFKISKHYHTTPLPEPHEVVLPLSQHTGKPAIPLVKEGDYVLKGQKICEADGYISSCIHSPVSGSVKEIKDVFHPVTTKKQPAIVIQSDGKGKTVDFITKYKEYFRFDRKEIINFIREGGIVGLGGAMFPTDVKLSSQKEIKYLLINGCECEPYLTCDDRLMQDYPREIVEGIKIVMYLVDALKCIVVIEDNKREAFIKLKEEVAKVPNLDIIMVKTRYPQGAEKQLIKTVLGLEVPSGRLPLDIGVIVHNVGTVYAIYNRVVNGIPLYERVVTISGDITRIGNFIVPIGTTVKDIVKLLKIDIFEINKIIFGGPMMGIAVPSLDVPVIKGTTGILFLKDKTVNNGYNVCIRCGKCVNVCPMNLMPNLLSLYIEHELWDKLKMLNQLYDCIECGCCSYICVSKRPIVAQIKFAKSKLKELN